MGKRDIVRALMIDDQLKRKLLSEAFTPKMVTLSKLQSRMADRFATEPRQTAQVMFGPRGTLRVVAAHSEADAADSHAINGDLLAWGDYNEQMNQENES